jgi:MoaA/NifB/PqqE/SkfB family radical SAM enzyme
MKPLLLHYYVTNRCNSRCVFCDIWKEQPKVDAKLHDVSRNLAGARKAGCKFVDFTGGEPLLNPHLPEFLAEARHLGFITSVTTNCLLFAQEAPRLQGLIDLLHFSIDSGTSEEHNAIRGVESYAAVIESIDCALKYRMTPDLLFTYTNDNIGSFERVYAMARQKKLMVLLDPVFSTRGPDTVKKETHRMAAAFGKMPGVYLNKAHLLLRDQGGNHVRDPLCRAVTSTIVLLPDNQLALPCFHHRSQLIPIDGDLNEILAKSERMKSIGRQGRYSFCEGCHINCYFDPSFQALGGRWWLLSMKAKARYAWMKYVMYRLRKVKVEVEVEKNKL